MTPSEIAKSYDSIAHRWLHPDHTLTGIPQHQRAIQFLKSSTTALDVGCGCNDRFIQLLKSHNLTIEALDISQKMISLARQQHPEIAFHHADICQWTPQRQYDFITAWDSIWHVPLDSHAAVLQKLCAALAPNGVLIFTLGGTDSPGFVTDSHMGTPMYTSTLGIPQTLHVLAVNNCICRHLEYDQLPHLHTYMIAQKAKP